MTNPTITVIGRIKNKAGAYVDVTKIVETVITYTDLGEQEQQQTRYGWHCHGCTEQEKGSEYDTERDAKGLAGAHAKRCRFEPAN